MPFSFPQAHDGLPARVDRGPWFGAVWSRRLPAAKATDIASRCQSKDEGTDLTPSPSGTGLVCPPHKHASATATHAATGSTWALLP
jgi:hypothetical protein